MPYRWRFVFLTISLLLAASEAPAAGPELPPLSIQGLRLGMQLEDACAALPGQSGTAPVQPAKDNFTALERKLEGTALEGIADVGFGCESQGHGIVILSDVDKRVRLIELTPKGLEQLRDGQGNASPEDFTQAVTSLLPLSLSEFREQGVRLGLTYRGGGWSMTVGNDYLLYYLHDAAARR